MQIWWLALLAWKRCDLGKTVLSVSILLHVLNATVTVSTLLEATLGLNELVNINILK